MKNLIPYLIIVILPFHAYTQENKPDHLVDAGRLVVDLIQLFKKDKKSTPDPASALITPVTCPGNVTQSTCFTNRSKEFIKLLLFEPTTALDTLDFIISDRGSECAYQLPSGVYNYIVSNPETNIVSRKGQLKLNACIDQQFEMASR